MVMAIVTVRYRALVHDSLGDVTNSACQRHVMYSNDLRTSYSRINSIVMEDREEVACYRKS